MEKGIKYAIIFKSARGRSSLGRTSRLHREGRGFESPRLHQNPVKSSVKPILVNPS